MRAAVALALFALAAAMSAAADPPAPNRAKARAAAALALAASCDCPKDARPKCGDVAEVLAKVSAEIDAELARPAVAPMPREKAEPKAVAPVPSSLPPGFTDQFGCVWTPHRAAEGGVVWSKVCPRLVGP